MQTLNLLDQVGYDQVFSFQYSPRPNTAALQFDDAIPEGEKGRRLRVFQEWQKKIQLERYETRVGTVQEVLVEGQGGREGQWKGRTTQNIVLNFTVPSPPTIHVRPGDYWNIRITKAGHNSFLGEAVSGPAFSARPRSQPRPVSSPFLIL